LLVYAAIPTSGLPPTDAADYASFLQFAATTGQQVGFGVGQLPSGYLPLTAADGVAGLSQYTLAAALDVAAQNGQVPPLTAASGGGGGASNSPPSTGSSFNSQFGTGSLTGVPFTLFSNSSAGASSNSGKGHGVSGQGSTAITTLHPGAAVGLRLWTGGSLVPLALLLALFGAFGFPALLRVGRRRGKW
jgi:hypothetical protein